MAVKFYKQENQVPLEMHKVRVVQKLHLLPVQERLRAIQDAGNNTFLLQNKLVHLGLERFRLPGQKAAGENHGQGTV